MQLLCGAGANQNLPTMNGETRMHIAAARGHEAIVQLLRHGGATLDAFASLAMRFKVSLSQCICLYLNLHSKLSCTNSKLQIQGRVFSQDVCLEVEYVFPLDQG